MNLSVYNDAVKELAIPKLTAFLKMVEDMVEIENWIKMRAPEKREQMLEAFKQSKELRKEFVAYYENETGTESDFSEWETADLPETPAEPAPEPPSGPETMAEQGLQGTDDTPSAEKPKPKAKAKKATTPAPTPTATPASFVEGAFEQIIADVAGLDAEQSKVNLVEAEDRMEFEHVRIGALLHHVQTSEHYVTLGYDTLREMIAAETGLHYRKAMHLISNYNTVKELGITAEQLKGVTWSALRHITSVMTKENYTHWLDAARNNTHVALIAQVEKEKAKQQGALPAPDKGEGSDEKPISKVFNVLPDQNANISAAIEKAKTTGNVDSNGAALDIIASSYVGSPVSEDTVAVTNPDTSKQGFMNMFSKMAKEGGNDALVPVLEAIGEIWPDVDITVSFPSAKAAE